MHMYKCIKPYAHTLKHTRTFKHTRTYTHVRTHTCKHAHTQEYPLKYVYKCEVTSYLTMIINLKLCKQ